jgi:hypothetical protein
MKMKWLLKRVRTIAIGIQTVEHQNTKPFYVILEIQLKPI